MVSDDDGRVVLTAETWTAFLQALAHALASLDARPTDAAGLLRRAAMFAETHPLPDLGQGVVRANLVYLTDEVERMRE